MASWRSLSWDQARSRHSALYPARSVDLEAACCLIAFFWMSGVMRETYLSGPRCHRPQCVIDGPQVLRTNPCSPHRDPRSSRRNQIGLPKRNQAGRTKRARPKGMFSQLLAIRADKSFDRHTVPLGESRSIIDNLGPCDIVSQVEQSSLGGTLTTGFQLRMSLPTHLLEVPNSLPEEGDCILAITLSRFRSDLEPIAPHRSLLGNPVLPFSAAPVDQPLTLQLLP